MVLTEFLGQEVAAWSSWLLYQVFIDAHLTSVTSNETIDECLFVCGIHMYKCVVFSLLGSSNSAFCKQHIAYALLHELSFQVFLETLQYCSNDHTKS